MSQLHPLLEKNAFQRLEASLATIKAEEKLFILKDEHGCVMLTTDEEDGVPHEEVGRQRALRSRAQPWQSTCKTAQ